MKTLILFTTLLFTSFTHASISLENKTEYDYECMYSTPRDDENSTQLLVIVSGTVKDLSELKGKQEVIVDVDGDKTLIRVGNCKVEM